MPRLLRLPVLALAAVLLMPGAATAQPAAASLSEADRALLDELLAHVNGIDTMRAAIVEEHDNGPTREGTFYLDRPGRLRVAYDNSDDVLVADGDWLIHYDGEQGSATQVPLEETLAGVLARGEIALDGTVTITAFTRRGDMARVELVRTQQPEAGSLTLMVNTEPPRLRQWIVADATGRTTRVSLFDHRYDLDLSDDLFQPPAGAQERF